jgi:hypothetical protein
MLLQEIILPPELAEVQEWAEAWGVVKEWDQEVVEDEDNKEGLTLLSG